MTSKLPLDVVKSLPIPIEISRRSARHGSIACGRLQSPMENDDADFDVSASYQERGTAFQEQYRVKRSQSVSKAGDSVLDKLRVPDAFDSYNSSVQSSTENLSPCHYDLVLTSEEQNEVEAIFAEAVEKVSQVVTRAMIKQNLDWNASENSSMIFQEVSLLNAELTGGFVPTLRVARDYRENRRDSVFNHTKRIYKLVEIATACLNNYDRDDTLRSESVPVPPTLTSWRVPLPYPLNSNFTAMATLQLSDQDVSILWKSFSLVKMEASEFGPKCIAKIMNVVPDTFERFVCIGASNNVKNEDKWKIMQQGFSFLNGIERCILRLKHPRKLIVYVDHLVNGHRRKYAVGSDKMSAALNAFGTLMVDFVENKQLRGASDEKRSEIFGVWNKFFGLMNLLLVADNNKNDPKS